ncbi:hypothetical protein C1H46_009839 [Malus baccata]|uniref:Uncharacterized protein n=1 Tax=Malus baccata TaxID=106549 RepID=A0A540N0F7_MALBA|nr:hypothetical protein C1H46_009839 [Malus baccata]
MDLRQISLKWWDHFKHDQIIEQINTEFSVAKPVYQRLATLETSTSSISIDKKFKWLRPRRHQRAESVEAYLESFKQVGLRTLAKLLEKLSSSGCPADYIVYDAFIPCPLDVAKKFGIVGVVFFTQPCAVDYIYYHAHKGLLKLPLTKYDQSKILLPGLPPLELGDMPSRLYDFRSYPAVYDIVVGQFSNVDKADCVLCNSFYELEEHFHSFGNDIVLVPIKALI